jgi:hypothetical protein
MNKEARIFTLPVPTSDDVMPDLALIVDALQPISHGTSTVAASR